jgi:hypothetical protein
MRQIAGYQLWLGHVGDARDLRTILDRGIVVMIDLAVNEPPATVNHEMTYCRFPIVDGDGNPDWLLRTAIETTAGLIRDDTPTLVFCSAGMSRSPAIAAAAISVAEVRPPHECLEMVAQSGAHDVLPGLWRDVCRVVEGVKRGSVGAH